jgi:hypothetical protein
MKIEDEILIQICECSSFEHQLIYWWCEEDKTLYVHPHLYTYRNFFQRLWMGLKYIVGYKSRYGEFDSLIFSPEHLLKLKEFLNK